MRFLDRLDSTPESRGSLIPKNKNEVNKCSFVGAELLRSSTDSPAERNPSLLSYFGLAEGITSRTRAHGQIPTTILTEDNTRRLSRVLRGDSTQKETAGS